jgi:beta-lactamase regulating signal transducer with metallopeptidase domain
MGGAVGSCCVACGVVCCVCFCCFVVFASAGSSFFTNIINVGAGVVAGTTQITVIGDVANIVANVTTSPLAVIWVVGVVVCWTGPLVVVSGRAVALVFFYFAFAGGVLYFYYPMYK